jgi:hypothetical protein
MALARTAADDVEFVVFAAHVCQPAGIEFRGERWCLGIHNERSMERRKTAKTLE